MNEKLLNRIKSNKLFENIDISALNIEQVQGKFLTFSAGQMIFSEGDPSEYIYLIISGQVSLMKKAVLGGPDHISLTQNDFFGMEELAEGVNRICTAVATEDTYAVGLTLEEIQTLIDSDIQIQENIFKYTAIEKQSKEEEKTEIESSEKSVAGDDEAKVIKEEQNSVLNEAVPEETIEQAAEEKPTETGAQPRVTNVEDFESYVDPLGALDDSISPPIDEAPVEDYNNIQPLDIDIPVQSLAEEIPSASAPELDDDTNIQSDIPPVDSITDGSETESTQTVTDLQPTEEIELNDIIPPDIDVQPENDGDIPQTQADEIYIDEMSMPPMETQMEEKPNEADAPAYSVPEESLLEQSVTPVEETLIEPEPQKGFDPEIYMNFFNALISAENVSELTYVFGEECAKIFNAEAALLFVKNDSGSLETTIETENGIKKIYQKIGEGITGLSYEIGEKIVVQDAKRDSRIYTDALHSAIADIRNLIAVPFEEEDTGFVLAVINKSESFEPDDEHKARKLFESFYSARLKFNRMNELMAKEKKNFSNLMVSFLKKNIKSKTVLIKNYADHLLKKALNEEEKSLGRLIKDTASDILDKFYFAAIIDDTDLNLRLADISLNNRLEKFFDEYENYFQEKYCTLIKKFDGDAVVRIDAELFERALREIAVNAIEAMPFGGNLTVRTKLKEEEIEIYFSDSGSGLEEENLSLMFEPFVSFNKQRHSGFGLAFVKAVINAMGGKVAAKKRTDRGLTIIITLPTVVI